MIMAIENQAAAMLTKLSGWGHVAIDGEQLLSENLDDIVGSVPLTRGLGRSYGDSSLPPISDPVAANSTLADRILGFDEKLGVLRAEAGLSLLTINQVFTPRGWTIPVSPGTQFVTLGGMVASDVHGKNHHRDGCLGQHIEALRIFTGRGPVVCSPTEHPDLFRATLGGMGLTGHILEVALRLRPIPSPWIWSESERVPNIESFLDALKSSGDAWPYTVGWIDCLARGKNMGRGILIRGRWATQEEAPARLPQAKRAFAIPFRCPSWVMSQPIMQLFNVLYYWKHWRRQRSGIAHPQSFFYPLDAIRHWNRLYGKQGVTQYQCVLPDEAGRGAARRLLDILSARGGASFLCVIKDCGAEGTGMLSFPRRGISIALDLPVRADTQALVDALNEQTIKEGGRIYLTKDALTRKEHFMSMEPRLGAFNDIRRHWDPAGKFKSAQSIRLFGDAP